MTPEQIKENLLKLHNCTEEFSIVFSGKKSVRINGLYKVNVKEILINNLNFEESEAGINLMFYTAMHEMSHHLQFTEHHQTGSRSHTKLFYSILDGLADKAEELGLYRCDIDPGVKALMEEAAGISAEIAALQRKLGSVLNSLHSACLETGLRYEDIVKRKVILSARTEKKLKKITALSVPEGTGYETQEVIAGARNEEQRESMLKAAADRRSVDQVKQAGLIPKTRENEDDTESLLREKGRIEKTIASLKNRLEDIMKRIKKLSEGGG